MAQASRSAAEARQSALELIRRYGAGESPRPPAGGGPESGEAGPAADAGLEAGPARCATPGFEVLDLRTAAGREEVDADEYRDLRDFVKNRTVRTVDRVFLERERRERAAAEAQAGIAGEDKARKLNIKGVQQHKLNLQKAKEIQAQRSGRGASGRRSQRPDSLAVHPGSGRTAPREPHSPRKSPPSILSPGHHGLIAWNGVPQELRKAYFDSEDARDELLARDSNQEDGRPRPRAQPRQDSHAPRLESRQEQLERVRQYLGDGGPTGDLPVDRQDPSAESERSGGRPESDESATTGARPAGRGNNAAAQQQTWLERRAMERRRTQQRMARNKTSQAIPTVTSFGDQSVSCMLRNSSSCSKFVGYSELCQRARQQVLDERKHQLEELARRRDAVQVLQRALRGFARKRQTLRKVAEERAKKAQAEQRYASKLQAMFRGHAARVGVQAIIVRRTRAACKLQRLVRESRSWRRLQRERNQELRVQQQLIKEEAAAESDAEREHVEWVHRVLDRAQKESHAETRVSMLSSTPEHVRNWVIRAPKVTSVDHDGTDSGRELVVYDGRATQQDNAQRGAMEARDGTGGSGSGRRKSMVCVPRLSLANIEGQGAVRAQREKQRLESARRPAAHASGANAKPSGEACEKTESMAVSLAASARQAGKSATDVGTTRQKSSRAAALGATEATGRSAAAHRRRGNPSGDEIAAMNSQIESELSRRVVNVHGRVDRLRRTMRTISNHEQQIPALRFSSEKDKP